MQQQCTAASIMVRASFYRNRRRPAGLEAHAVATPPHASAVPRKLLTRSSDAAACFRRLQTGTTSRKNIDCHRIRISCVVVEKIKTCRREGVGVVVEKKEESRQNFNKNSCDLDLLTAITHTEILVARCIFLIKSESVSD